MTGVEGEMRGTLAAATKEGIWNYAKAPRTRWILDSLGMVTLAGSQVGVPRVWGMTGLQGMGERCARWEAFVLNDGSLGPSR